MTSNTALHAYQAEARSPDDFSMPFVAIVSVQTVGEGDDRLGGIAPVLARHGGQIVEVSGTDLLAVFPRLDWANGFAREVQRAMLEDRDLSLRLGINLGAVARAFIDLTESKGIPVFVGL